MRKKLKISSITPQFQIEKIDVDRAIEGVLFRATMPRGLRAYVPSGSRFVLFCYAKSQTDGDGTTKIWSFGDVPIVHSPNYDEKLAFADGVGDAYAFVDSQPANFKLDYENNNLEFETAPEEEAEVLIYWLFKGGSNRLKVRTVNANKTKFVNIYEGRVDDFHAVQQYAKKSMQTINNAGIIQPQEHLEITIYAKSTDDVGLDLDKIDSEYSFFEIQAEVEEVEQPTM